MNTHRPQTYDPFFQPRRLLSYRRDFDMPLLRLFITPLTDNSLPYLLSKVKTFWAQDGPYLAVLENFVCAAACRAINRTVLGPANQLSGALSFVFAKRPENPSRSQNMDTRATRLTIRITNQSFYHAPQTHRSEKEGKDLRQRILTEGASRLIMVRVGKMYEDRGSCCAKTCER